MERYAWATKKDGAAGRPGIKKKWQLGAIFQ
jgi:hypothetical protein